VSSGRGGLTDLLRGTRGQVVELLRAGPAPVAVLAERLGLTEAGVRRHLQALERDGLVAARTVRRPGRGRPASAYALTDKARRLEPDRSAEFANEALEYLESEHGRSALLAFIRWRQGRHAERYADALDGVDDPAERATRLAELLSEDGFASRVDEVVTPEGRTVLQLRQGHCTIGDVAAAHPEVCAYEAALFQRLLGGRLSRRQTIAGGAGECICTISLARTGVVDGHEG
jgi:predicted ArsR family transcriptional regulator